MNPPHGIVPGTQADPEATAGEPGFEPGQRSQQDLETHLVGCWLTPDGSHTDDLFAFDLVGSRLAIHLPSGATLLFEAVDMRKTMDGLLSRRLAEHFTA